VLLNIEELNTLDIGDVLCNNDVVLLFYLLLII